MSNELREIQLKVAKLKREYKKLKSLKSDCDSLKRFCQMLVDDDFD